jgi:hypothetical protein
MQFRPVHSLLLAAIVYWTTGAALYLHERMEHSEPDGDEVVAVAGHSGSTPQGNNPKHHHHDHDDCPTCQLLAHMQADHVAPPAIVCVHLPSFVILPVTDRRPPTVDSHSFIPIRGPPAIVCPIA